ncbi:MULTISPECIES: phosphate ABC transporter permease [unclassified Leptolyngbya]|uniref:phosphate ABC transporter permease n=1 Tax=unclassified Leptolyngbya TaxID=2650499 RepID=UPI00168373D8|nr:MULTISPECIES: phosphate ABC transporter permease [unclassified Leptolyngbya]MBD1912624.1 phosphate ABC transporter permease [Leptolyngbya sp. FACHB-8]MBD2156794.1 phosphate ABC transporter permease [Leptolyngbya sp. FACHB-16]
MLIPLTRAKFEELVPRFATGEQYRYASGKLPDFLRRLLISVVGLLVAFFFRAILPESFAILEFLLGITTGLYWLWSPIYWASRRNAEIRRYPYAGFLQGEVLDAFPSEEVIGTEETVNKRGELVVIENRERRLNLEIGDEEGFTTFLQVPLQQAHRAIRPGDRAELLVVSYRPDLSRIEMVSDVYLSDYSLWVSDYPYVRRDMFVEVSHRLDQEYAPPPPPPRRRRRSQSRR